MATYDDDDSFISCQEIRENTVFWFKLLVLGYKWGRQLTLGTKCGDILGIYLPPKHVLWYIGRQAMLHGLHGVLCRCARGTK